MTAHITHFIDGKRSAGQSGRTAEVFNPNTGQVQSLVPMGSKSEVDAAVASAAQAQQEWAAFNPQRRARVMMRFVELVNEHVDEIAELLSREHGKTLADSRGDIQRGIEVIEFCIGIPHLLKGEYSEGAGPGIDVYSLRRPLHSQAAAPDVAPKAPASSAKELADDSMNPDLVGKAESKPWAKPANACTKGLTLW